MPTRRTTRRPRYLPNCPRNARNLRYGMLVSAGGSGVAEFVKAFKYGGTTYALIYVFAAESYEGILPLKQNDSAEWDEYEEDECHFEYRRLSSLQKMDMFKVFEMIAGMSALLNRLNSAAIQGNVRVIGDSAAEKARMNIIANLYDAIQVTPPVPDIELVLRQV